MGERKNVTDRQTEKHNASSTMSHGDGVTIYITLFLWQMSVLHMHSIYDVNDVVEILVTSLKVLGQSRTNTAAKHSGYYWHQQFQHLHLIQLIFLQQASLDERNVKFCASLSKQ